MVKYKVLFHLDEGAMSKWKLVLANIENLLADTGDDVEIELLANAEGIGILYKQPNPFAIRVESLAGRGVRFVACGNTMRQFKIEPDFLLECAAIAPAGIGEIVRRQAEGWLYVRP